jgi:DtxR family Mn-dependent transcriptional regulator
MSTPGPTLSRSAEDYLKAIYSLSEQGEAASTSAVAEALDVQPASVTGMVKRLAEAGLLAHLPYRGVRLTESGVREALKILRRHRIIETYLCERLGYTWDDVHGEAERLEHAVSDQLIERMAAALGFPSHDPHGAPIPTKAGDIEAIDFTALADATAGEMLRIRAVQDDDAEHLRAAEALGLLPGARVEVASRSADSLTVSLQVGSRAGETQAVHTDVARRVFVVPDGS